MEKTIDITLKILGTIVLLVLSFFVITLVGTSISSIYFVIVGLVDLIILFLMWKPINSIKKQMGSKKDIKTILLFILIMCILGLIVYFIVK